MMSELTPQILLAAIHGNLEALARVLGQPHKRIQQAADAIPVLEVTPADVRNILLTLLHDPSSRDLVQRWASFVRHGYVANSTRGPILPITIEWAPEFEDEIIDVIARLDEMDDPIDGDVTSDEIQAMLSTLPSPP